MAVFTRCWMLSSTTSWIRRNPVPFLLVVVLLNYGYTKAVAECLSGNKLKCFECNSHKDEYCADPFNWTTLPPIKVCEGCCVKIVQGMGTPEAKVRRGCTDSLEINYFMVDHVCMSEGGGRGKMCFCEENECNAAPAPSPINNVFLVLAFLFLILIRNFRLQTIAPMAQP